MTTARSVLYAAMVVGGLGLSASLAQAQVTSLTGTIDGSKHDLGRR